MYQSYYTIHHPDGRKERRIETYPDVAIHRVSLNYGRPKKVDRSIRLEELDAYFKYLDRVDIG